MYPPNLRASLIRGVPSILYPTSGEVSLLKFITALYNNNDKHQVGLYLSDCPIKQIEIQDIVAYAYDRSNIGTKMESESLKQFLDDIVQEKAGIELDLDVRKQLIEDLYERLENKIYRALVSELNDQQLTELQSKDRTPEEILKFIENSGIIIKDTITRVLVRFRASYIAT